MALQPTEFQRGDADADGQLTIGDAIFVLSYLFLGGVEVACEKSADASDDGKLDQTDAIFLLNFLFLGGPSIPAPFNVCGQDPSEDGLSCESFAPCP